MAGIRKNSCTENDFHANNNRLWKLAQNLKEDDKKQPQKNARLAQEDGNILSTVTFARSCKMFQLPILM